MQMQRTVSNRLDLMTSCRRHGPGKRLAMDRSQQINPSLGIGSTRHCTTDITITRKSEERVHRITRVGISLRSIFVIEEAGFGDLITDTDCWPEQNLERR